MAKLTTTLNDQIDALAIALYTDERENGENIAAHYALQVMSWELDYLYNGHQWQANTYE